MTSVCIIGIGIHPFGRTDGMSGRKQGIHAARLALKDAGIEWPDVQFAYGGSSAAGAADVMVRELGLTGIPFTNVSNGCATGGSALISAFTAIESGRYGLGMAVGFDKHPRGSFNPDPENLGLEPYYGETGLLVGPQFFAMKIQRYMHQYGISKETLGLVAQKAFRNGVHNPNAWRRSEVPLDTILNAEMICHPLTKYMFCSPSEGGVAIILASEEVARRYTNRPVFLRAVSLRTRMTGSFEVWSPMLDLDRAPAPSAFAAKEAFEMAGAGPRDMDVIQLQDTESGAEVMHMAETGFCADGEQEAIIKSGDTAIGGRMPVNTDGGCIASGEPVGASGLRQIFESVLQLRGEAGERQVPGAPKTAFTHVYGAPGVSACTVLQT